MDQSRLFHIFISHHPDDLDFVEAELLPRLADAGLSAATGEALRPGFPRLEEMARLVQESRHTLALITPRWLADGFADFQAQLSRFLDPGTRSQRFIPLLLGVTSLPPALAHLAAQDLNDSARRAERLARLCAQLAGEPGPTHPSTHDPLTFYRAPRAATLYGREELIAQLAGELSDPHSHTPWP